MLTKHAAAEQLRKYASAARFIREQREMQKRAEPKLSPNSWNTDDPTSIIQEGHKTKPLPIESGKMSPSQRRAKAWQRQGLQSTRIYQPGDWFKRVFAQPFMPAWMYSYYYPIPNHYHTPREE